ncbi:Na+ dependent nucleoside transporter C-terminus-domain-containing protein [Umbelopsis sp. PMI_123]|nr:Na+ dependent nucleoside transporter C-terminus-domain-containing protein [Umbelopsis sp. PMI_123]
MDSNTTATTTPVTESPDHHQVQIDDDNNNILPLYEADRKEGSFQDNLEKTESPVQNGIATEEEAQAFDGKLTFDNFFERYRNWIRIGSWLIFTGFLIAAFVLQVPKGYNQENLILGLIYAWTTLYFFFCFVPTTIITKPWNRFWYIVSRPVMKLSLKWRKLLYCFFTVCVIIITIFSLPVDPTSGSTRVRKLIALFGMLVFLFFVWASSNNRKSIPWLTVSSGMLLQFLLALFVFKSSVGYDIFNWASTFASAYLGFNKNGLAFVFDEDIAQLGMFIISVVPAVIFFCSTVYILFYIGTLQWIIKKAAVFFMVLLGTSGAESIVAVASPFIGQGESALLIRPFVPYMTKSELHQVMTSGFATISGSVLYAYMQMGVPGSALLTACIMSIPCSLAISKLRYPETEESLTTGRVTIPPRTEHEANVLHAAGNGAAIGLKIGGLIVGNIISLLALLAAVDAGLTWIGNFITIQNLTLELVTGYILVPVAWLMGIEDADLVTAGRLLATKLWANEFVAYNALTTTYKGTIADRTVTIITYALCGFANLSSIGIQISVLGALAPERTGEISRLAVSAMICGALCTCLSASMAGMLL